MQGDQPEDIPLGSPGDSNEFRCTVFRSRNLQRRQRLEKGFVQWACAFSERKTRSCLSTRCSLQRRCRTLTLTLVEWHSQASKEKRCRRLEVLFVMRLIDRICAAVFDGWRYCTNQSRRCGKAAMKILAMKVCACFEHWARSYREQTVLQVRISQSLQKIDRRGIFRSIREWRALVVARKRINRQVGTALRMSWLNNAQTAFTEWHACVLSARQIIDNDSDMLLHLLMQSSCKPVFTAWRKRAKLGKIFDASMNDSDLLDSPLPVQRTKPSDMLSRRVIHHRVVHCWLLVAKQLLRVKTRPQEKSGICDGLRRLYRFWADVAINGAEKRRKGLLLLLQRKQAYAKSITLCALGNFLAYRRHLTVSSRTVISHQCSSLQRRFLSSWKYTLHLVAREVHLQRVAVIVVKRKHANIRKYVFDAFERNTLACPFASAKADVLYSSRTRSLCRTSLCIWSTSTWGAELLKNAGTRIRTRCHLQSLKVCFILWVHYALTAIHQTEKREGRLQDFPYDCRVLLMKHDFPYGSVAMCALVGYHRIRAMSLWDHVTGRAKLLQHSHLLAWSAEWTWRSMRLKRCAIGVERWARRCVARAMSCWSWMRSSRCWRQKAVTFCLQRHDSLLMCTTLSAWQEASWHRAVARHVARKICRVKVSFAVAWWHQYAQEKRLCRKVQSPVHFTNLLVNYFHIGSCTDLPRARSIAYFGFLDRWSWYATSHRQIWRLRNLHEARLVRLAFEGLVHVQQLGARASGALRKATSAADNRMKSVLFTLMTDWGKISGQARKMRYSYRKTVLRIHGIRCRSCFAAWCVITNIRKRCRLTLERISRKIIVEKLRGVLETWLDTLRLSRFMGRICVIVDRRSAILLLRHCMRGWISRTTALNLTEMMLQHDVSQVQSRVYANLAYVAFEIWAGRTNTITRLRNAGLHVASITISKRRHRTFLHWVECTQLAKFRRRGRNALKARRDVAILMRSFTAWLGVMEDFMNARYRSHCKTIQVCVVMSLVSTENCKVMSHVVCAWYKRVAETLIPRRTMAANCLVKAVQAHPKYIMGLWYHTFGTQRRGRKIACRSLSRHTFSCLRRQLEGSAVCRRRATDIAKRKQRAVRANAFAVWARKAKLFSHIADLASLSCKVLVKTTSMPHLVTITNLEPSKYLRAYYVRERSCFGRWRRYSYWKEYLRNTARTLIRRARRCRMEWCLWLWRDGLHGGGFQSRLHLGRITQRLTSFRLRCVRQSAKHAILRWSTCSQMHRLDAYLVSKFALKRVFIKSRTYFVQWTRYLHWRLFCAAKQKKLEVRTLKNRLISSLMKWSVFIGGRATARSFAVLHHSFSRRVSATLEHSLSYGGNAGEFGEEHEVVSPLTEPLTQFSHRRTSGETELTFSDTEVTDNESGRNGSPVNYSVSAEPVTVLSCRSRSVSILGDDETGWDEEIRPVSDGTLHSDSDYST